MHELAAYSTEPGSTFKVIPNGTPYNGTKNINQLIQDRIGGEKKFFGIEISPSPKGKDLDYSCFGDNQPLFTSITWLFDHNINFEPISMSPALKLAKSVQECNPVLLHLTCYKFTESKLDEVFNNDIENILALRGDLESDTQPWKYAIDLVKAIREQKSDATIAVAGYPEVHPTAISRIDDLTHLKEKVMAGANFIITNTCFSIEYLTEFIKSCRSIGITVPIIPGIYVPASFIELNKMCSICHCTIPNDLMDGYRRYQDNNEQFTAFAVEQATNLLKKIFEFDFEKVFGCHFFTLNNYELIVKVLRKCDFTK